MGAWGARLLLALLWLLHGLPLAVQARLGRGLGALLFTVARARRKVALRNLALCFPELSAAERERLARDHFGWLGRSIIEHGLLWWAPPERLRQLIHVEGDVHLAERSERPVMWLAPHFMAVDVVAVAGQLFQTRRGVTMYQAQSNAVMEDTIRRGRLRLGNVVLFTRQDSIKPLVREIKQGAGFFNLPDMDFGTQDADFVPFFGIPASTLLAPSRMARALNMVVQPVIGEILPGGQGYRVRFLQPLEGYPSDDPLADAARLNRFFEAQIRTLPAQYLWVHKRFKTRPPGAPKLY